MTTLVRQEVDSLDATNALRINVAIGTLAGVAWSSAMRGWMIELAGAESAFHWRDTFGFVLLPGALIGGLFGYSAALAERGPVDARLRRALIAAPLTFGLALIDPANIARMLRTGEGTGGLGIAGISMLAGYALSGRGRRRTRVGAGIAAVAGTAAVGATSFTLADGMSTPRGVWAAVLAMSLVGVLGVANSLPYRLTPGLRSADGERGG